VEREVVELTAFASNGRALEFYEKVGSRAVLVHLERPIS
jgi:hypothetical protein